MQCDQNATHPVALAQVETIWFFFCSSRKIRHHRWSHSKQLRMYKEEYIFRIQCSVICRELEQWKVKKNYCTYCICLLMCSIGWLCCYLYKSNVIEILFIIGRRQCNCYYTQKYRDTVRIRKNSGINLTTIYLKRWQNTLWHSYTYGVEVIATETTGTPYVDTIAFMS